jgi:hypothetical protein
LVMTHHYDVVSFLGHGSRGMGAQTHSVLCVAETI